MTFSTFHPTGLCIFSPELPKAQKGTWSPGSRAECGKRGGRVWEVSEAMRVFIMQIKTAVIFQHPSFPRTGAHKVRWQR